MRGIRYLLHLFHILTGLKVNFNKSLLYGYHQDVADLISWSKILESEIGSGDILYLGANVSASSRMVKFWDPLVDKVQKKIATWKRCDSQAGRLVLLKAALDSIPVYLFSLFVMPKLWRKDQIK